MTPPLISSLDSWSRLERLVLAILEKALFHLQREVTLPEQENDLNRKLYFYLVKAQRELYSSDGLDVFPIFEANNQPDPDDMTRAKREGKRPDFQYGYFDYQETDERRSAKCYVVECKRLGTPSRPDWIFNKNYVLHGVYRFKMPEWGYGQSYRSGAMIGYVQSMDMKAILAEVNFECKEMTITHITADKWQNGAISRLSHEFDRDPVQITPFSLQHLWIDLRRHYSTSTNPSNCVK